VRYLNNVVEQITDQSNAESEPCTVFVHFTPFGERFKTSKR
jgi:hypothetical protein